MLSTNSFYGEIPLGFGILLAQNIEAMTKFAGMTPEERQQVITRTHNIESKKEMRGFVDNLAKQ